MREDEKETNEQITLAFAVFIPRDLKASEETAGLGVEQ